MEGAPVEEILRTAEDVRPDLVVMGTHGRSGVARLLMGSVADQVVRRAHCPVITVKTPLPMPASSGKPDGDNRDPVPESAEHIEYKLRCRGLS